MLSLAAYPLWAVWKVAEDGHFMTKTFERRHMDSAQHARSAFLAMTQDPRATEVGLAYRKTRGSSQVLKHWMRPLGLIDVEKKCYDVEA